MSSSTRSEFPALDVTITHSSYERMIDTIESLREQVAEGNQLRDVVYSCIDLAGPTWDSDDDSDADILNRYIIHLVKEVQRLGGSLERPHDDQAVES